MRKQNDKFGHRRVATYWNLFATFVYVVSLKNDPDLWISIIIKQSLDYFSNFNKDKLQTILNNKSAFIKPFY